MAVDFDGNIEEEKGSLSVAGSSAVKDRIQERLGSRKDKKRLLRAFFPSFSKRIFMGFMKIPIWVSTRKETLSILPKKQAIRRVLRNIRRMHVCWTGKRESFAGFPVDVNGRVVEMKTVVGLETEYGALLSGASQGMRDLFRQEEMFQKVRDHIFTSSEKV